MFVLVLLVVTCASFANGANILGVFSTPSISHQVVFQPIWRELSLRGHQVTVITPNPLKDPKLTNLTEIDVNYSYSLLDLSFLKDDMLTDEIISISTYSTQPRVFGSQMNHSSVISLLKDDTNANKFDLVLVEMLWPPSYAFAYKFNSPYVGLLSLPDMTLPFKAIGNPVHPVLMPDSFLGYGKNLSFWQRLKSTYAQVRLYLRYDYEIMPEMDRIARKYFGNDMPYLGDIEKNVSIILSSHNFITSKPKPTVPALIEIGNVHIKKNLKLPQDLQQILDGETKGMIYFSLGSNVKSANISTKLRNTIISAFSELPYKVLWKWETDYLPGKPDNVIIRKWLPQEAVLAHPNVKVFITQGGLQSMDEAIYYRTPLVGMPFFADQMKNVKSMREFEIGIELNTHSLTKEQLKSAILEVFNNKKYQEKISELADVVWDHPMTGLETAVWWIEYVLRHKGAKHLRSPLLDIPLYQYLLLDVLAFVFGVISVVLGMAYATWVYLAKPFIHSLIKKEKLKAS